MDIEDLRCFVTVAEDLHFGRAARRLHLTASPLSRRIREMERELGAPLFVREYHKVELTQFGTEIMPAAQRVLKEVDDLQRLARRRRSTMSARAIRVGATLQAPPYALDAVMDTVGKLGITIRQPMKFNPSKVLFPELLDGSLDLAVVHLPVTDHHLRSLTVGRYLFGVAMRSNDVLADRSTLKLSHLRDRELCLTSGSTHPTANAELRNFLTAAGISRVTDVGSPDPLMRAAKVATSRALALVVANQEMPGTRVFADPRFRVVALDEPDLRFLLGIAWNADTVARNSSLEEVVTHLQERFSGVPILF